MVKAFERGARREVTHVHIQPIAVVQVGILVTEKVYTEFTEFWDNSTHKSHESGIDPVGREHIIDAKELAGFKDQFIVVGYKRQQV